MSFPPIYHNCQACGDLTPSQPFCIPCAETAANFQAHLEQDKREKRWSRVKALASRIAGHFRSPRGRAK